MFSDMPLSVLSPFIFATIVYFMAGLQNTFEKYFIFMLTVELSAFAAGSMGLVIRCSSWVEGARGAAQGGAAQGGVAQGGATTLKPAQGILTPGRGRWVRAVARPRPVASCPPSRSPTPSHR